MKMTQLANKALRMVADGRKGAEAIDEYYDHHRRAMTAEQQPFVDNVCKELGKKFIRK